MKLCNRMVIWRLSLGFCNSNSNVRARNGSSISSIFEATACSFGRLKDCVERTTKFASRNVLRNSDSLAICTSSNSAREEFDVSLPRNPCAQSLLSVKSAERRQRLVDTLGQSSPKHLDTRSRVRAPKCGTALQNGSSLAVLLLQLGLVHYRL